MQEVEAICDRVIIINNGVLIHDKSLSDTLKATNLETLFTELTNQK
jgi:ABC-type Na+ transport system ATPase subunit NatA